MKILKSNIIIIFICIIFCFNFFKFDVYLLYFLDKLHNCVEQYDFLGKRQLFGVAMSKLMERDTLVDQGLGGWILLV